ncbi:hypothetical protein TRVL_04411 [Trypanosoma vivax]|nr:hypothetical protein TRVL_04411 [Trypanosoma vivax]
MQSHKTTACHTRCATARGASNAYSVFSSKFVRNTTHSLNPVPTHSTEQELFCAMRAGPILRSTPGEATRELDHPSTRNPPDYVVVPTASLIEAFVQLASVVPSFVHRLMNGWGKPLNLWLGSR